MAALDTVADYLGEARTLLQDTVSPFRYSSADLVAALNYAFLEISRIRPDILSERKYLGQVNRSYKANRLSVPTFSDQRPTDVVDLPLQVRMSVLLYIVGFAQIRDAEDVQDQRASAYITNFAQKLVAMSP